MNSDIYLNRGNRSVFLAVKPDTSLLFAVDQLAYILEREKVKTIIKVGSDKEQIVSALKISEIKDRVSCKSTNVYFLQLEKVVK